MKSIIHMVAAAVVAVALVAGCGRTVAGNALPDAAVASRAVSSTSAPVPTAGGSTGSTAGGVAPSSSVPQSTPSPGSTTVLPTPADTLDPPASSGRSTPGSGAAGAQVYPTHPGSYDKNPQTQNGANLLEARRIAAYLVAPTFINSSYHVGGNFSTLPLRGPAALSILFTAPVPTVAQRAGMITGFSSARSDAAANGMVVAAFEFATAAQASAAVRTMAAAAADKSTDKRPVVVGGFPAAAGWYGTLSGGKSYFQTFTSQGRMVLYVYLTGTTKKLATSAQQAVLTTTVLKAESASMAAFVPTPPADLMKLLVDPDSMLGHTVPNGQKDATVLDGLYSASAQLHFDSDPVNTKALFATAGVDEVADGRSSVYRARDTAGAAMVRDGFVASAQKTASGMQPYTLTTEVPSARCIQQALNSTYYCVGVEGRYAFEVSAGSASDLDAAMTAQYAMLGGF